MVRAAYVNIDNAAGMDLAQQLDILSGGIPAVVVFSKQGRPPQPIMRGAPLSQEELASALEPLLAGLSKSSSGLLAKNS